jgi:regulator of sirC expression with transglutaminase-like and TPR domain
MVRMDYLRQMLESASPRLRLDRATLDLARIQFPELDHAPVLDDLNAIATGVADSMRNFNDGREFVERIGTLFVERGWHVNEDRFLDPRNSCLNHLLATGEGLPITLSLLYMEVARRLQMPVYGIGLPNRFVVQFDDGNYNTYVDPGAGGRVLSTHECFALAGVSTPDPAMLARATPKQIVMRMLQNLLRAYLDANDYTRAIVVLDHLLLGAPEIAAWYRTRGRLHLAASHKALARQDLERYLELEPMANDRDTVREQIHGLIVIASRHN